MYSLLMTLKLSIPLVGRNVAEHWLATSNSDRRADTDNWTYSLQVIEIYATRILPACGDLGSARSFVEYNSLLSNENKEVTSCILY
ncbi:hypothetical protein BC941DRAFT_45461 [Chlamydoabsidia padenii]|nr:hypothetical protein BC941DRAFT_45461 [Chlamydoabsidia padenii]